MIDNNVNNSSKFIEDYIVSVVEIACNNTKFNTHDKSFNLFHSKIVISKQNSMKIEVTFNKSARKQFRQECVKRLQNFVAEIRNKCHHLPPTDDFFNDQSSQDSSETKINFRQYIQSKATKDRKEEKESKSTEQSENKKYIILTPVAKNETQDQSRQQRKTYKQNSYARNQILKNEQNFNLFEMKENVNAILDNLQKNVKSQRNNHNQLEAKIETVNRKLDRILAYLEHNQTEREVKSEFQSEQQLIESQKEQFYSKFDSLADKYQQIKLNSPHQQKANSRQSKEPFSLSSTRESVTFRYL